MKACLLTLLLVSKAFAQSETTTTQTDINGRRVEYRRSASDTGTQTEQKQSINGTIVPLERIEEKILREGPDGKTVERIIHKFDATGRPTSTERVLTEERKLAGGGASVQEIVYRSDVNGAMKEAERRNIETRVSGDTTTTETAVARPSINGSFETTEKRTAVKLEVGDQQQVNESVQRRGDGGQFREAIRQTTVITKSGDSTTEQTATYEPGMNGQLELFRQSLSSISKRPDGTEVTETNLYGRSADGRAQERGATPQMKEQQIIERKKAADGSTIETLSVRRPTVADPNRLGNPQKLYETVCQGVCAPAKQ